MPANHIVIKHKIHARNHIVIKHERHAYKLRGQNTISYARKSHRHETQEDMPTNHASPKCRRIRIHTKKANVFL